MSLCQSIFVAATEINFFYCAHRVHVRLCANSYLSVYIWTDSLLKALRFTQTACHLHIIWVHGGKRLIFRTWLLHPSYLKGFLWTSNRYPVSFHVLTQSHPTEGYDLMNSHQKTVSIKSSRNERWSGEAESLKIPSHLRLCLLFYDLCVNFFFLLLLHNSKIQHEIDIFVMIITIIYVQLTCWSNQDRIWKTCRRIQQHLLQICMVFGLSSIQSTESVLCAHINVTHIH